MSPEAAQEAVSTSAFIVAGVYFYRKFTENGSTNQASQLNSKTAVKQLAGVGGVPPMSHFLVGWGAAFIVLSLLAQVAPTFGGSLAILLATADLLTNGIQITRDITTALNHIA
jgi:hypothetical protein